jgi:DNA-directed RNA polymerase subunit K/omega
MIDYKKSKAPATTVTVDTRLLDKGTGNVYESVLVCAKRANQISVEIKQELNRKLEEFAYYTDNLEEVFENREQIEISRFYERLPKPASIALQEFLDGKIYHRLADNVNLDEPL